MLVSDFLYQAFDNLKQRKQNVSLEQNSKDSILKLGNRGSDLCFRMYDPKTSLRFEHEMKGKFIRNYQSFLMNNQIEPFKNHRFSYFLAYSGKTLPP